MEKRISWQRYEPMEATSLSMAARKMRIAGGMFGFEESLEHVQAAEPQFMREPRLLFLSARCAIQFLIENLKPPQVWMPSFLCCSMIDAVDQETTAFRFFPIGFDLEVASLDWLDLLLPGSLVVLIDYFGFPCDNHIIGEVQARGSFVLEDASQALLSTHAGLQSDYTVFSPRKFLGVPDGGILQYRQNHPPSFAQLFPPPPEWWLKALEACIARREFDRSGGERRWYDLFQQVEATYPLGPYRMSELSEMLLESSFNYQWIANTRRSNYKHLLESLSDFAIFKNLNEDTVPLGFPIRLKKRDEILQFLFDHDVFPPVHWQISECVPYQYTESHRLSAQIMTVPCDQRLSSNDIIRILDLLRKGLGTLI